MKLIFLMSVWAVVLCKEVYYDLTASYFPGAPDGVTKQILGFNLQFPGPTIRCDRFDTLTIKVTNMIQDKQTTTIHWHGIEQYLEPFQDGPRMVTQCDIPYNTSYVYQFHVKQSGTYWYHAHHLGQYTQGLWGAIIISNVPAEVHKYDGEFLLTLNDWFHPTISELTHWYEDNERSKGEVPFLDASLLNGVGYYNCQYALMKNMSCFHDGDGTEKYKLLEVERGKTYRLRILNPSAIVSYLFTIDGHKLEPIETDGVDTIRIVGVDEALISTGTRSSFLVKMDGGLDQYWLRATANILTYRLKYPNINPYIEAVNNLSLAILRYKQDDNTIAYQSSVPSDLSLVNEGAVQGRPGSHGGQLKRLNYDPEHRVDGLSFYANDPINLPFAERPYPTTSEKVDKIRLNWKDCHPFGGESAPLYYNQSIVVSIPEMDDPEGKYKPGFNNVTYNSSTLDKPALIKVLNGETLPFSVNPIVIEGFGEDYVVEIIVNDYGDSGHPLHLHGHTFWVMGWGQPREGPFVEERDRPKLKSGLRRETFPVQISSWMVIRFRADNPGVWMLHCHMDIHVESGLALLLLEGIEAAREIYQIPEQTTDLCRGYVTPSSTSKMERPCSLLFLLIVLFMYNLQYNAIKLGSV